MINAVGREIPDEILRQTGKEPFQGNNYKNGVPFRRYAPIIRPVMDNQHSKLVANIREALIRCKAHSGMTVSFHHHFREGDLIVNMVMKEIHDMGFKNITLAATSLGKAHDPLVPMIEDGTITSIQASGVRGKIGEAISHGKLKGLAIMRSHGGRVRSLVTGETKVDIAFIGAPTSDDYGNLRGVGGKSNCGVLSYSHVDGDCAEYVVAITDTLVPYPNFPAHISQTKVDCVVVVDAIASTISLTKIMEERGIKMGFGVGGLTKPMCDLLDRGMVRLLLDTQAFDMDAVTNVLNPAHHRITAGAYANPFNKGAFVNKLDYVILASLEVDVHFNCNVVVGSDGVITGAQGGHPDTAQGAKCTIVICPLLQGRIPAICSDVTTVTTPGESVDIVVTDYGVAVNPNRHDLLEALEKADCVPLKTIEELRDIAYSIVGEPDPVEFGDRVVGIIEARDGTIMDVVREVKD